MTSKNTDFETEQSESQDRPLTVEDLGATSLIEKDPIQRATTASMLQGLERNRKKRFLQRNLKAITPGGIRSSILTFFSTSVGGGVLSLPHVISYYGLIPGLLLLILGAIVCHKSFMLINEAIEKSGKKSYPNIASHYLGKRVGWFYAYMFFASSTMVSVVYTTIVWSTFQELLNGFYQLPVIQTATSTVFDNYDPHMITVRAITMLSMATILLPINLQKELSSLKYVSAGILIIILLTILLTVVQSPRYYEYYHIMRIYEFEYYSTDFNLRWFSGLSTVVFSYACHHNFFLIRAELRSKTTRRVKKIVTTSVLIELALYIAMSTAGYLSLGKRLVPDVFTLREPLPGTNDILMYSIQWIFLIVMVLHVPINVFIPRNMLFTFFGFKRTRTNWVLITVGMTYVLFGLPILYPDILGLFGIFGGIFSCTDVLIMPYLIGFRMRQKENKPVRYLFALVVIFALFNAINSVVFSVIGEDIFDETKRYVSS